MKRTSIPRDRTGIRSSPIQSASLMFEQHVPQNRSGDRVYEIHRGTRDFAPRRLHIRLHNRPTDWPKGAISDGSEWKVKWKDKEDGL